MTYYIQIEDCQNNCIAIVKVEAENKLEAKYKALRALHIDDNLYSIDKDEAQRVQQEDGVMVIDEDGEEIDLEEDDEDSCLPKEFTLSIDSCLADAIEDSDYVENYIETYMAENWGHCVIHYSWSVEKGMLHVTNIEWDVD